MFAIRDMEHLDELRRMAQYIAGLTLTDADRYALRIELQSQRQKIGLDKAMRWRVPL
jgi:hypothetical protein